ncbi:MAG: ATP-binding protein, partial [Thermomicrobiaceae bacterium]|nr:ATP-binding protein [Thermomicrobiaceae bacterium]
MKRIGDVDALRALSTRRSTSMGNTRTSSDTSSECPICRGAGYLRYDVPVGHPKFGELIVCSCKAEQQDARRRRELLEMSSLEAFEHFTFDTFDPNVPGVREAYEACLEYAQNPHGWLFLLGRYGCGKTHLAAAVAQHAMTQQGMTVLFIVVPDLLDQLRAAFAPNSEVTYDAQFF